METEIIGKVFTNEDDDRMSVKMDETGEGWIFGIKGEEFWVEDTAALVEMIDEMKALIGKPAEPTDARLEELRRVTKEAGADGEWDYNEYSRGIYNGLEGALAIMEGRRATYRSGKQEARSDELSMLKARIDALRKEAEASGAQGVFNYSERYYLSYYWTENALAMMEGRCPTFKPRPDKWLCDEQKQAN